MKTTIGIKGVFKYLTLIIVSWFLTACMNGNQKAGMSNDSKQDPPNTVKDAKFLATVAMINMEEIKLGELAQQNSSMMEVKELGQMIEDDHKKSQDEITELASKKSITLPTSLDTSAESDYKKLVSKSGNEFDKEYTNMMVKGHKDAIEMFKQESEEGNDADIRKLAMDMLPTLQKHLDHAMSCQEKSNNL